MEVKNTVVVNEREAAIVRHIFSMAADGMSSTQIAKRLFAEGGPLHRRSCTRRSQ